MNAPLVRGNGQSLVHRTRTGHRDNSTGPLSSAATYHDLAHLGIDYRTPKEVRQTWEDAREAFDGLQKQAARTCQREAGAVHLIPESTDER
jgi:hypothetical protein